MYNKVESLKRIRRLRLNIHNTVITDDLEEVKETVSKYKYMCSIRTDKETGVAKDLPFYLISDTNDYLKIREKLKENKQDKMMFIISNGHQYDDSLRYNMVLSFDRNNDFRLEYNAINVPLRHMYRFPEQMINIEGNIDETVASWKVDNKEHNRINIREVGRIASSVYMEVYNKSLWDRNLELSIYNKKCGELDKEYVYWEI